MNELVRQFALGLIKWRWLAIVLSLLIAAICISGARHLKFSTDYRIFFDQENPYLTAFEELEKTYTKLDNLLFVLKPEEGNIFTPETLAVVKRMTDEAWQIPYSTRVDSISNFQHTRADGDDLVVRDLVTDVTALTTEDIAEIRRVALSEPLLAKRLVAVDAKATGILVTIQIPDDAYLVEKNIIEHAEQLMSEIKNLAPNIEIRMTGQVALAYSFFTTAIHDLSVLTPIMFCFLAIMLIVMTQSLSACISALFVVGLSAGTAMGMAGWIGSILSGPTTIAPTVILTVAIADAIHILISMRQMMRKGLNKHDAIVESLRINWGPVFLTSLTTVIGFLCLNFAKSPPYHSLGNISAIGAAAAWFYSIVFLPALMAVLPFSIEQTTKNGRWSIERIAEMIITWRTPLLWITSLLMVIFTAMTVRLEINDNIVEYMEKGMEFRDATDFANEHLNGGVYTMEYSVESGEPQGISNPDYLKNLDRFANWLRQQPEVVHVNSFTDVMRRLNFNMHGDNASWYRLPESRELAAQYLLLYEMSLPYGLDLNNQINIDKSATRLTVTLNAISTNGTQELITRVEDWLKNNLPPVMHATASSPHIMFAFIFYENVRGMLLGTLIAFVAISAVLMISLRNIKMGLISFIPNLTPVFMAFGIYSMFEKEIGLPSAFVAVTSLGLVVDATVHFFSKYLRAQRENHASSVEAIRYVFSTVGTALWVSASSLIVGFSVLTFSPFKVNSLLGLMVAITIAIALIIDFLLLPPLLMKLDKK